MRIGDVFMGKDDAVTINNIMSANADEGGDITCPSESTAGEAGSFFVELARSGKITTFNFAGESGRFAGISYAGPENSKTH